VVATEAVVVASALVRLCSWQLGSWFRRGAESFFWTELPMIEYLGFFDESLGCGAALVQFLVHDRFMFSSGVRRRFDGAVITKAWKAGDALG
jgi:hypothetical protein